MFQGRPFDESIDLWSLGVSLFYLITGGSLPDVGESTDEMQLLVDE